MQETQQEWRGLKIVSEMNVLNDGFHLKWNTHTHTYIHGIHIHSYIHTSITYVDTHEMIDGRWEMGWDGTRAD